tara:strand:- start:177 stop:281 length:105 start_codon:yes stop_codon:yes gene_type:complete
MPGEEQHMHRFNSPPAKNMLMRWAWRAVIIGVSG